MKLAFAVVSILFIFILIKYIMYRRQIESICRQLAFLQENSTNKRIRTDLTKAEILQLAGLINSMYEGQADRELKYRAKDRRLKETLTNVSHDIRTPLTSLKGYFQLMISEKNEGKKEEYAGIISEKIEELAGLLEELFTYTKLQNEEYILELTEHDLTRLAVDTLFSFYGEMKEKGIRPEIAVDETAFRICCNDIAVKRVISNLLRNAILHGTGEMRISYQVGEKRAVFLCENMIAVPEEINIRQIFERFYKADRARSRNSTGLGLAIAKELAERMGGGIQAELKGNWFRISFFMGEN